MQVRRDLVGHVQGEGDVGVARLVGREGGQAALDAIGLAYGELPTEQQFSEIVRMFEHAVLTEQLQEATAALRRAELSGDTEAIRSLLETCKELSTRRETI